MAQWWTQHGCHGASSPAKWAAESACVSGRSWMTPSVSLGMGARSITYCFGSCAALVADHRLRERYWGSPAKT
jgi:hypothetical protein